MPERISVIGNGSWATAITKILHTAGHSLTWWVRQTETADYIRQYGHNPKYLSSVSFDLKDMTVTSDIQEAVRDTDYVVLAVPSAYILPCLHGLSTESLHGKVAISAIKGMELESNRLISEYVADRFLVPKEKLAHISGPCHAEEVAAEKLSFLTFSSFSLELAGKLANMFRCRFLNTEACGDMVGTEYAAVLKNIYAIAAGISVGLGYGDNFRAVLLSRAMDEMRRFLEVVDPAPRNLLYPAYLGDTLVTAYSPYSRNRGFGLMIGKGYTVNAAILELNMVAEGYYGCKAIHRIAESRKLPMPIADSVYRILYDRMSPSLEFHLLTQTLAKG